jgi:amidohydrolase
VTGEPLNLTRALATELPAAVELRHQLHAEPRLSGQEETTTKLVLEAIGEGSITRVADTGALLRVGGPGPCIAVRAELDALPVSESTGVGWASVNGAMHACGHDVHLAAVSALARTVARTAAPAPLLVIFQPREETYPSGAADIVACGALDAHDPQAYLAAHVQPLAPPGTIACAPGAINASADEFTVTFRGVDGHAGYPHLTRDPVLAVSQFVVAVQHLVSRNSDPMVPSVVAVGALSAGDAANATPSAATARGTVRAMTEPQRALLHQRIREVAQGTALAHDCTVETTLTRGEPVLVNDAELAHATNRYLDRFGVARTEPIRSCGADDFAFYGDKGQRLMMFAGVGDATGGLHGAGFLPPDAAVGQVAIALLAGYLAAAESIHR